MARTIDVQLGDRGYPIAVGEDLLIGSSLMDIAGLRILLVSDSNVAPLHADSVRAQLEEKGASVVPAVVPAGESSKSIEKLTGLYDAMLDAGLDRKSVVLALGGGVIGDLAGFAAATYLRGIRLVQMPTSLLAMVDSSVGGKTGINLPQGKNLVGSFYQPVEVNADLAMLRTLPEREYISGMSEIVKYGVIWDAEFFTYLEENTAALCARDSDALQHVICRSCEIKAEVVAMDERESGVRAILNFGHTLGHALENVAGYGEWLHGEAVALGMVYAAHLSVRETGLADAACERIGALLAGLGLPVSLLSTRASVSWDALRKAIAADKKTVRSRPRFVLSAALGSATFGCDVSEECMADVYRTLSTPDV